MNHKTFNFFLIALCSIFLLALTIAVDAHINKYKHAKETKCSTPTPTPTPACCSSPNSLGWNNLQHTCANILLLPGISTSQDCCNSCASSPICLQWRFNTTGRDCMTCYDINGGDSTCTSDTTDISGNSELEGGVMYCDDINCN